MEGERVGVEGGENRSRVSPLLHFTVALLPAGDIQAKAPNHMKKTCTRTHELPSTASYKYSDVTHHYVLNTHMMCTCTRTHASCADGAATALPY